MGCDIHIYLEQKEDSGDWECFDKDKLVLEQYRNDPLSYYIPCDKKSTKPLEGRDYQFFGIITGGCVRRAMPETYLDYSFLSDRGIPEDVSEIVNMLYAQWDSDAHSATYITFEEVKDLVAKHIITSEPEEVKTAFNRLYNFFKEFEQPNTQLRLVYWFDN